MERHKSHSEGDARRHARRKSAEAEDGRGLPFEDVQHILCNIGITYTRPEFLALMEVRGQLENLHESLTQKFLKSRYQQSPARFAPILESGNISESYTFDSGPYEIHQDTKVDL